MANKKVERHPRGQLAFMASDGRLQQRSKTLIVQIKAMMSIGSLSEVAGYILVQDANRLIGILQTGSLPKSWCKGLARPLLTRRINTPAFFLAINRILPPLHADEDSSQVHVFRQAISILNTFI